MKRRNGKVSQMRTGILLWIALMALSAGASAQEFTGIVKDAISKEVIPAAIVYIDELQSTAITDTNGQFVLKSLPDNVVHLHISYLGYQTLDATVDIRKEKSRTFYLEPAHTNLQEVVVSVPHGKLEYENIVSVERRNLDELKTTAPLTLASAITRIPGVSSVTTGAGIGKPVIRGLTGNRIVTYAQNIRIENQQWGDEHGLGVGEEGIESVEVIKGPASLLYGADALGGVLYFVDERYAPQNSIEGRAGLDLQSNTLGFKPSVAFKYNKNKLKFNLFGATSRQGDYQIPGGERVWNTRFDEENVKGALGYNNGPWVSNLRYSYLRDRFGITESDSLYSGKSPRVLDLPFQRIVQHTLSWENTLYTGDSKWRLVLGRTDNRRKEFEDDADNAALDMQLTTYTYDLRWYSAPIMKSLTLIAGSQGMHQVNGNFGEELLIPDAQTNDAGAFVIASIDKGKVSVQGGVRYDFRQINTKEQQNGSTLYPALTKNYTGMNYSIGASYINNHWALRSNWSTGFRAPNSAELLSNGIHEGTLQYVIGNRDLKSEQAGQGDVSLAFFNDHIEFSINPFVNFIRNYIYLNPIDTMIDGVPAYQYTQSDALLRGGEARIHWHPHSMHWLHLESAFSVVRATRADDQDIPLMPPAKWDNTLSVEWPGHGRIKRARFYANYTRHFAQNHTGEFETPTPAYGISSLGGEVALSSGKNEIQIKLGVNNLFDIRYIDHLSRFKPMNIPNPGRNIYFGLVIPFHHDLKGS